MCLKREQTWYVIAGVEGEKGAATMPLADAKGYDSWVTSEVQALSTIYFLIDPTLHHLIEDQDYGSAAWKILKAEFEGNTRSRRYEIRHRFNQPIHHLDHPIEEYIQGVLQARKELMSIGCSIDDTETCDMIIMNLNPAFDTIRTTLIAREKEPTLTELQTILKEADRDLKKDNQATPAGETALAARRVGGDWKKGYAKGHGSGYGQRDGDRKGSDRSGGSSRSSGIQHGGYRWCDTTHDNHCHRCGQTGHIAARCIAIMPPEVIAWIFNSRSRNNSPTRNEQSMSVRIQDAPDLYDSEEGEEAMVAQDFSNVVYEKFL